MPIIKDNKIAFKVYSSIPVTYLIIFYRKCKGSVLLEVHRPDHQVVLYKGSPDGESDASCYDENTPPSDQPVNENVEELKEEMRRQSTCCQRKQVQEVRETTTTTSNMTHTSPWKHRVSLITKETVCTQTVKDTNVVYKSQSSCLHRVSMTTSEDDDTTWAPACPLVSEEGTITRHCGAYSDHSDSDSLSSSSCGGATFSDLSLSSEEHSSCSIQQAALQSLLECEQDFVDVMHRGIQMFSRPLRHHILTSQQHSDIFQNVEKVTIIITLIMITAFQAKDKLIVELLKRMCGMCSCLQLCVLCFSALWLNV